MRVARDDGRGGGSVPGAMITFGSLFAGIGGIDLGLERAGMTCKWQVEIDPYCQKVLAKHWPNVERFADVRECGSRNLAPVDLICGGFPCQPHSLAGKRRGAADDRNLWPEYLRIVKELRPRWVLGENVPGIRTTMLDTVLSDLEAEGYTCGTFNIPACAFDAPHRRERIFVVAHAGGKRCEPDNGRGVVSNENGNGKSKIRKVQQQQGIGGNDVAYAEQCGCGAQGRGLCEGGTGGRGRRPANGGAEGRTYWAVEPPVGRVAHGIPRRVDRLRSLGNAVVPQVVTWIGSMIMELETS